jgi:hypothetical protein
MPAARWIGMWLLALAGCVVVAPPAVRPRWQLTDAATLDSGCVAARAFIRKSGKTGFGMAVQLKSKGDCDVTFGPAALVFPDGVRLSSVNDGQPKLAMKGHSLLYAWLPIGFDNNDAWNQERNAAVVEVPVTVGTATTTWKIPVEQRL